MFTLFFAECLQAQNKREEKWWQKMSNGEKKSHKTQKELNDKSNQIFTFLHSRRFHTSAARDWETSLDSLNHNTIWNQFQAKKRIKDEKSLTNYLFLLHCIILNSISWSEFSQKSSLLFFKLFSLYFDDEFISNFLSSYPCFSTNFCQMHQNTCSHLKTFPSCGSGIILFKHFFRLLREIPASNYFFFCKFFSIFFWWKFDRNEQND